MPPKANRLDRLSLRAGLIWLLAGSWLPLAANAAWFTRVWKTDDGLLNNNIHAIVQSRDNYLWVVPPVGLMRFDGVTFSRFPLEDFTGSIATHVSAVLCSRTGTVWIATYGGKVIGLNPDFSVVPPPKNALPPNAPLALAEDKEGSLWVGYLKAICRIKDGQVTRFDAAEGVPAGNLHSLTTDGDGDIWLAKGTLISFFHDGQFRPAANARGVRCLAGTRTNAIWYVAGSHLLSCDTHGVLRDYGEDQALSRVTTRALLEDRAGAVWIGTDGNGLFRYSKSGFERIEASHAFILSLAQDREGNIWAGTAGGGLDRVSLSGVRLEALENNQVLSQIQSICQDTSGVLWGTTYNGALIRRFNGRWKPAFTNAPFAGTASCVAADRQEGIWIGTRDGKLLHWAGNQWRARGQNAIHGAIYALLPTLKGDLWIVARDALHYLHDGQLQNVNLPPQASRITAITEDAAGHIWAGAKGIVMRFNGERFVDGTPRLPVSDRVCCLYGTPDGSLWISCGGLGLLRFKDGHVGQVGMDRGLYDNYISQIIADGHGWLWFGSDHGIFRIRQRELDRAMNDRSVRLRPIVYGRNEGLSSLEALFSTGLPFVFPRPLLTRDGRVWLLTHTGIVVADPRLLSGNSAPPPVLITRVAMDNQTIATYSGLASTQKVANLKTWKVPLRLPPGHRHLEFDYTAVHFSAPENIQFRYRLVGFDNEWIDAKTQRHADYSRLTAGNYQFRVEASLGDGPWSKMPATLALTVAPFFWQNWWFRLGGLLLFTSTVIAVVRYISFRRLQEKMRRLEQRAALDRERTRIARDLHDDLGCSLNRVALTLDMLQHGPAAPQSENGRIRHCSAMVRGVAQSVDEIVWAINPRNDKLRYMVDYISQFAVEFLQAADVSCVVDLPDAIPHQTVTPEVRHNMLLVVKEALNNITRHARATQVSVRISTSETQVSITIEDNGCGFEHVPDNASCDGLRNMRQRIEEIGGQFHLTSRPGTGTCVGFTFSWPARV